MKHNPLDPTTPLPHNEQAEITILACILDPREDERRRVMSVCENTLTEESFYLPAHATIWSIMLDEHKKGTPMTESALCLQMQANGVLNNFIDVAVSGNADVYRFSYYLAEIINAQVLRKAFSSCYTALKKLADPTVNAIEVIGAAQSDLTSCMAVAKPNNGSTLKELWHTLVEQMQMKENPTPPVATGLSAIDNRARGGPRRQQLVLIGALRHVGKTALARQLAINAGTAGRKVLCFFAESADIDEAANTMAVMSGLPAKLFTGDSRTIEAGTIKAMTRTMTGVIPDIRIDTEPNMSVDLIESRCRYAKETEGLDVVFIDYLQFLNSRQAFKGQNREQMLADDARRIKVLARQLDVLIYLLVQLNDEVAPEDTPEICHIRESKGPANHADVILLMSAPDGISHDPTDSGNDRAIQRRHLWVRKWRGVGAFSAPINLHFNGSSQRFLNATN